MIASATHRDGDNLAIVVMPCFNEATTVEAACASLGFDGASPSRHALVLVDNGSTDTTAATCHEISAANFGEVVVVSEPVRGHVPARAAGVRAAADIANARSIPANHVVVVQADADARYSPAYVDQMSLAVTTSGPGHLASATVAVDHSWRSAHPALREVDSFDASVDVGFVPLSLDVIVDDKAVAYTLADYFLWGGHRRETRADGVELLAESARLFLAGVLAGASAVDVPAASVWHSPRRLEDDAVQQIASAGFPYGPIRLAGEERVALVELDRQVLVGDRRCLDVALQLRRMHLLGLFRVLPALVAALLRRAGTTAAVDAVIAEMPQRAASEVHQQPGLLIADVLDVVAAGDQGPLRHLLA